MDRRNLLRLGGLAAFAGLLEGHPRTEFPEDIIPARLRAPKNRQTPAVYFDEYSPTGFLHVAAQTTYANHMGHATNALVHRWLRSSGRTAVMLHSNGDVYSLERLPLTQLPEVITHQVAIFDRDSRVMHDMREILGPHAGALDKLEAIAFRPVFWEYERRLVPFLGRVNKRKGIAWINPYRNDTERSVADIVSTVVHEGRHLDAQEPLLREELRVRTAHLAALEYLRKTHGFQTGSIESSLSQSIAQARSLLDRFGTVFEGLYATYDYEADRFLRSPLALEDAERVLGTLTVDDARLSSALTILRLCDTLPLRETVHSLKSMRGQELPDDQVKQAFRYLFPSPIAPNEPPIRDPGPQRILTYKV